MAIKIDLLPGYVHLQKRRNLVAGVSVAALAVWVSVLLLILGARQLELETAQENLTVAQAVATQAKQASDAAAAATAKRGSNDAAIKVFLTNSKSGAERAALLNLIRQYIYEDSVVTLIDASNGKDITIKATVRDPDEYVRFLKALRNSTGVLFASDPKLSGVPGFANGAVPFVSPPVEPGGQPVFIPYPITVTAVGTLKNPVQLPDDPVGAPAGAAGAPGAAPGGAGGA